MWIKYVWVRIAVLRLTLLLYYTIQSSFCLLYTREFFSRNNVTIFYYFLVKLLLYRGLVWVCWIITDNHKWWCHLQEWAMASWMFHMHPLQHVTGWTAFHFPWWETILCWLLWWALCQEVHCLLQAHHRSVMQYYKLVTYLCG